MADKLDWIRDRVTASERLGLGVVNIKHARGLLDRIDLLHTVIAQHAANTILSGRDVHKEDRDLWRAVGQDAIDAAREDA